MARLLLMLILVCVWACPGYAGSGYPIMATSIAKSVLAAHPELAGDAIEPLARVEARTAEPALVAGPLERWSASSAVARVRLHCQDQGACLPFYALVHLSVSDVAPGAQPRVEAAAGKAGAAFAGQTNGARHADAAGVRTGQQASMVIDSGLLHLRMPVTCLQAGVVGSTIRVAGPGRSKIFEVFVLDRATVRGSL